MHLLRDRRHAPASAEVVEADDTAIAFLDIAPATRGHTLVIPRNHSQNVFEIDPEDLAARGRRWPSRSPRGCPTRSAATA